MAQLLSINVGLPRDVAWRGETVHTAIWKQPVQGRIPVRRLNVEGDGQGDLAGHGGEHRAVMVYQMDAYRYWETQLGRNDFSFGQFGENFTVVGLPDDEFASAIDTALEARSSRSLSRASHAIAWVSEWQSRQWLLCLCHITGLASTFECWRKVKSAPAMNSDSC
jgi:hypothetical protein